MTSSLTTALEEMTVNNEQLRRENNALKVDNTQLMANNDAMKDHITQLKDKQKDEIGQLTTLMVRWLVIMKIKYNNKILRTVKLIQ